MEATIKRLQHLVETNCRAVIDEGHDVEVEAIVGAENILFEIHCEPSDVGLIIGSRGKNIEAIRTIVRSGTRGAPIRTAVEVLHSRR